VAGLLGRVTLLEGGRPSLAPKLTISTLDTCQPPLESAPEALGRGDHGLADPY